MITQMDPDEHVQGVCGGKGEGGQRERLQRGAREHPARLRDAVGAERRLVAQLALDDAHARRLVGELPTPLHERADQDVRALALEARLRRADERVVEVVDRRRAGAGGAVLVGEVGAEGRVGAVRLVDRHPRPLHRAPVRHVHKVQRGVVLGPRVERLAHDLVEAVARRPVDRRHDRPAAAAAVEVGTTRSERERGAATLRGPPAAPPCV